MPRSSRSARSYNRRKQKGNRALYQKVAPNSITDDLRAVVSGLGVGFVVVGLLSLGALRLLLMVVPFIAKKLFPKQRHIEQGTYGFLLQKTTDKVLNEELKAYLEDSYSRWRAEGRPAWRIAMSVMWFLLEASYAKVATLVQIQFHRSL